jgi:hypothetical protein
VVGRDGRLGPLGLLLTGVALAITIAMLPYSLAAGTTGETGPVYPIAAFTADVGMLLFCIGAYRARLLPRPLVAAWAIAWILGGALGPLLVGVTEARRRVRAFCFAREAPP